MPTYDYHCLTCGHRFEYFQSITAERLPHCPRSECILQDKELKGTGEVVRMVGGGAGLLFKGSGFYQTDYGKGKDSAGEGTSSTSSTKTSSDTSDSKSGESSTPSTPKAADSGSE